MDGLVRRLEGPGLVRGSNVATPPGSTIQPHGVLSSPRWRRRIALIVFAFGDFAFNLYWQSVMLFLLFYYTEALGLPMTVAALGYTLASIWDGIANLAAGILADRHHPKRGFAPFLLVGAAPLGLAFVLLYLPLPLTARWTVPAVFGAHLLFRTAYALVNVPYLAMSGRISADSQDRALVAGLRMMFGTLAVIVVALGTVPIGGWLSGQSGRAQSYFAAAAAFAILGTVILIFVGKMTVEESAATPEPPRSLAAIFASLAGNRAFVTLNLAMMAMIVGVTVLNKSVLYYFKYFLRDETGGQLALASMGAISGVAVPLWILISRRTGTRSAWFVANGVGVAGLALFALANPKSTIAMQVFLVVMQVMIIGLNFVFWAMLPDTIEYGEKSTGLRVEGAAFGVAALLQRVSIGVATAILGLGFGASGYVANVEQSAATLAGMRSTIALVPLLFLTLSGILMILNPLTKGAHARILRDLKRGA